MTLVTKTSKNNTMVNLIKPLHSLSLYFAINTTCLFTSSADNMVMMLFSMYFVVLFSMLCENGMNDIEEFKKIKNTIDRDPVHIRGLNNNFVW